MIPYPENKPASYGMYEVQLSDTSITIAKWNGCGWANHWFNTSVIKFNPHRKDSPVQIWTFDKVTKQLIKI